MRLHILAAASFLGLAFCGPPVATMSDAMDAQDSEASTVADTAVDTTPPPPVQVMMDFTHAGGFYNAPFPSEDRRMPGDRIDLHDFPNPYHVMIVQQLLSLLATDVDGFGATSLIEFELTGPIDPAPLPDVHASLHADSPVFLVSVDSSAPDFGHRYPVSAAFERDGGPNGAPNLLTLLPQQGIPLRPHTLYAAGVLRTLHDPLGRALDVSPGMASLLAGTQPAGMSDTAFASYSTALTQLAAMGMDTTQLAGLAVFRTAAPIATMATFRDDILAQPLPMIMAPFTQTDVFDDYCVYHTTIGMPDYQGGTSPYSYTGGGWTYDANGHPMVQSIQASNLVVTVPRRAMPAAGFPLTVLIRTGAGGDRPLVDRGTQAVHGGPPIVPGSGPAMYFARAGFAGAQVDGPLGGLRNPTGGDEQFMVFNVENPLALRDNIRESALEIQLFAHIMASLSFDVSDCAGAVTNGPVRFDGSTMALMGHSMGATIAPLVLAYEPMYRAAILSGAGGSWIENVVYKQSPVPVRPVMELLLHYEPIGRMLTEHDSALSLMQWAGEPADPPLYDRSIIQEPIAGAPRNVFMVQGIVDTYILPPISEATSLSLGLDLGGMPLDSDPRLAIFTPLVPLLDLSGRSNIMLPAQGNVAGAGGATSTDIVVQALQDSVEDGHEVVFQTGGPKYQYRCFLQSYAAGHPMVPAVAGVDDPCP